MEKLDWHFQSNTALAKIITFHPAHAKNEFTSIDSDLFRVKMQWNFLLGFRLGWKNKKYIV